jgi:hypothetical protein
MYRTSAPRVRSGSNLHLHDLHLRVFQYGCDFSMFVKFSWIHLHVWTAAKLICSDFVGGNFVVWEHKSRPGTGFFREASRWAVGRRFFRSAALDAA